MADSTTQVEVPISERVSINNNNNLLTSLASGLEVENTSDNALDMKNNLLSDTFVSIPDSFKQWHRLSGDIFVRYEQFNKSDEHMNFFVSLFSKELSEPYSSFTYRHLVFSNCDLNIIAYTCTSQEIPSAKEKGIKIGAIISRLSYKKSTSILRAYIAMLAVIPEYRRLGLGSLLLRLSIHQFVAKGVKIAYLETPTNCDNALRLYLNLGFTKTKFFKNFYINRLDAVRLVLWLDDYSYKALNLIKSI